MCELYKKTIELLNTTEASMSAIAENTDVGLRWLYDLKAGRFSDPGIKKIERIYAYLSSLRHDDGLPDHLRAAA
jgi:hypothetical protein